MNLMKLITKRRSERFVDHGHFTNLIVYLEEKNTLHYRMFAHHVSFHAGGQDYFKQSNTRLHFIAERATQMGLELLGEPWQMVDEISALGLRHVGYGIPTETRRGVLENWRFKSGARLTAACCITV